MEPLGNNPYSGQTPPPSTTSTRLQTKIDGIRPPTTAASIAVSTPVNWTDARMFTPGDAVGYRSSLGIQHVNGEVRLFHSGQNSQGLIYHDGEVAGASVTTSIREGRPRNGTYVGYDKRLFDQEGKDFAVQETRTRGNKVSLEGGHLVDYKFSAGNSHTAVDNYFPQHHIVNAPLKEYVINRSDDYVEIILFTDNPPTVGKTKHRKGEEQKIPIGDILVQINQGRITNAYYFPNNDFNYEGLMQIAPQIKDYLFPAMSQSQRNRLPASSALLPYFHLKPCFHSLLQAAIITDFRDNPQGKELQSRLERNFQNVMDQLSDGMAMTACDSSELELIALASKVLHDEGHVPPSLLLDSDEGLPEWTEDQPLALPHKILGEFLIKYALRNALKSEVISINSRLMFLNVIIDFISNSTEVSPEAIDFIDGLASEFRNSFKELEKIKHTMSQQELFYYADTYRRLCSKWNHLFFNDEHPVCFMDLDEFLYKYVSLLDDIAKKYPIVHLKGDFAHSFLFMAKEAQDTIDYWLEAGAEDEEYREELTILKGLRQACLSLFDNLPLGEKSTAQFQSNIKERIFTRKSEGYARLQLHNLGFGNDTDESESSEVSESTEESESSESSEAENSEVSSSFETYE